MNPFKIPKLPTSPVALTGTRKIVSKEDFLASLLPLDVGLTRGGGVLGWFENLFRVKEKEGPVLMTHAFLHMAGNTIAESNWPCVKSGLPGDKYLGGKRHTVYYRFLPMEVSQIAGGACVVNAYVEARTPYAGLQILGFLPEFLGGKPASNKPGVICSEFDTLVIRSQGIPFVGIQKAHTITPTDAMTWLMGREAFKAGWMAVAESIGDCFYIRYPIKS